MIGQTGPGFPGFAGLTGLYREDIYCIGLKLLPDLFGVERADVRVCDDGVPMCLSGFPDQVADLRERPSLDDYGRRAELDVPTPYQVTSPTPLRTLATRASEKRRSERRFR